MGEQEVADVEAKYKLRASELAESVAALNLDEQAPLTRRPKKTSAYETLRKVSLLAFFPIMDPLTLTSNVYIIITIWRPVGSHLRLIGLWAVYNFSRWHIASMVALLLSKSIGNQKY